ncbi:hypothetical protein JHK85_053345 [Glycine max]|nr:hypothetical protein JHK85_053345 [Glycine max]
MFPLLECFFRYQNILAGVAEDYEDGDELSFRDNLLSYMRTIASTQLHLSQKVMIQLDIQHDPLHLCDHISWCIFLLRCHFIVLSNG